MSLTWSTTEGFHLRKGFGWRQELAVGMGGVRESRSLRQINRLINEARETRGAIRDLREKRENPDWAPLIRHRIAEGCNPEQISDEIYWIERYAWAKARGYSLETRLRRH